MSKTYKYELTPLPYAYNALEPNIDEATLKVHHDKHVQTYTDKLNKALEDHKELQDQPLDKILKNLDSVPEAIRTAVRNNGGGVYNHDLYFSLMTPNAKPAPTGELSKAIEKKFDSFDNFKSEFKQAAADVFGSGYAWLVIDEKGNLSIAKTANQDCVLSLKMHPVLIVDVWEHAYYLKYQNKRPDYLQNWWNVVNWDKAEELYQKAQSKG